MNQVVKSKSYYYDELYVCEFSPCVESTTNIVMLHGFPGWATKNYDIAEFLAIRGANVFVPHYPGLGLSKGRFGFAKSIDAVAQFINSIKDGLPICIVGHSWGGFIALTLLDRATNLLICLAPLCSLPKNDEELNLLIDYTIPLESAIFNHSYGKFEVYNELTKLRKRLSVVLTSLEKRPDLKIKIIHGRNDSEVSIDISRDFAKRFPKNVILKETDGEHHLIEDRPNIFSLITNWIMEND